MSFVFDVQRMIHIIQMNYGWSASSVSLTEDAVVNSKSHTGHRSEGVFSFFLTLGVPHFVILLQPPDGRWFTRCDGVMCR